MAKLKCKLVSIYALRQEKSALMKRLQELSVIDIDTAASDDETAALPEGYFKTPDFSVRKGFFLRKSFIPTVNVPKRRFRLLLRSLSRSAK